MLTRAAWESGVNMPELMDQQCRLDQSLQHQTECPSLQVFQGIWKYVQNWFYHWKKSGLVISFGVCIPMKVASVYRATSYLLNLNYIVYDNGVSSQTIVVCMKFPKEVPVVGWGKWAILPQFCTTCNFAGMHFFEILHVGYI